MIGFSFARGQAIGSKIKSCQLSISPDFARPRSPTLPVERREQFNRRLRQRPTFCGFSLDQSLAAGDEMNRADSGATLASNTSACPPARVCVRQCQVCEFRESLWPSRRPTFAGCCGHLGPRARADPLFGHSAPPSRPSFQRRNAAPIVLHNCSPTARTKRADIARAYHISPLSSSQVSQSVGRPVAWRAALADTDCRGRDSLAAAAAAADLAAGRSNCVRAAPTLPLFVLFPAGPFFIDLGNIFN